MTRWERKRANSVNLQFLQCNSQKCPAQNNSGFRFVIFIKAGRKRKHSGKTDGSMNSTSGPIWQHIQAARCFPVQTFPFSCLFASPTLLWTSLFLQTGFVSYILVVRGYCLPYGPENRKRAQGLDRQVIRSDRLSPSPFDANFYPTDRRISAIQHVYRIQDAFPERERYRPDRSQEAIS